MPAGAVRKLARIGAFNLDAIFHALCFCVAQRGFRAVAGKNFGLPRVHAGGFARLETLGGADHQQAAAAADIENRFIPAPGKAIEQLIRAISAFPPAGPHHRGGHNQKSQANTSQHAGQGLRSTGAGNAVAKYKTTAKAIRECAANGKTPD